MAGVLQKIVDERVGQTLVGTASVAVHRMAEEIAREALAHETFRRALRELVRVRSQSSWTNSSKMATIRDGSRNGHRSESSFRPDRLINILS